jgi:MFS family permease
MAVSEPDGQPDLAPQRWHSFRAFRNGTFRHLWAGIIVNGFAVWINRLTVGWFIFDQTDSALLTAVSFTMGSAPGVLFAPFGGAIADRIDRRYVLATAAVMKGLTSLCVALVAVDGIESAWPIIALLAVAGAMNSFELPSSQALIPDVTGPRDAMNGIAVCSVGLRGISAVGALTGGFLLELYGAPFAFMTAAFLHGLAAIIVIRLRVPPRPIHPDTPRRSVIADTKEGLRIMASLPTVRALLIMTLLVEVLCFSYASVLPVLARDRLGLDESDLGTLTAMGGFGSFLGALCLAGMSEYRRKGLMVIVIAALYGSSIVALGLSDLFMLSLVVVTIVGMMAAIFDALQWGLLQANVPDALRGRVLGGWMLAVSFGWIGHGELGIVSDAIGVHWAYAINGGLIIAVAVVALLAVKSLRRA